MSMGQNGSTDDDDDDDDDDNLRLSSSWRPTPWGFWPCRGRRMCDPFSVRSRHAPRASSTCDRHGCSDGAAESQSKNWVNWFLRVQSGANKITVSWFITALTTCFLFFQIPSGYLS